MGAALPLVMRVGWLGGFGGGMVVIAPGRGVPTAGIVAVGTGFGSRDGV
jgi:hypothetical protein